MNRDKFLEALKALPDEEFQHVVAVVQDMAKRLPEHKFGEVATAAGTEGTVIDYTPPDPEPAVPMITLKDADGNEYTVPKKTSPNDVTVNLTGVEAVATEGKF